MPLLKSFSFLWIASTLAASGDAATPTPSEPPAPCLSDPTDAIMQAASDGGDALIWFTREDDATPTPVAAVDASFARCRLRYPERSFERPDEARWFIAWANRFAVEAIPSVVAVDGMGRPYARLDGTLDATTLAAAREARATRDTALAAADASTGPDRARHLDAALRAVGPYAVRDYRALAEEVVTLDADNAAGLRDTYAPRLAEKVIDEVIQGDVYPLIDVGAYPDARRRLAQLEAALPGLSAEQRQTLTAFRAQLMITEGRAADARVLLREALALAPTSDAARQIRGALTPTP